MRASNLIVLLLIFMCSITLSRAQWHDYQYIRPLTDVTGQWHAIKLPKDIYGKVTNDLEDIRIIGINEKDTFEIPFLIDRPKTEKKEVAFDIINKTSNAAGFYYTFSLKGDTVINHLSLRFQLTNFDWKVKLEGGNGLDEWYTILDDYRILSIKNNVTDYRFTELRFPEARFRYFRLFIPGKREPELESAVLAKNEALKKAYDLYDEIILNTVIDKDKKQTLLTLDLANPGRISYLKFDVEDDIDYYRPFIVKYLEDSIHTEKGWKYRYRSVYQGTLSSLGERKFFFPAQTTQKLQVSVTNFDNQPLTITSIEAGGEVKKLLARFNGPGEYYLVYGNRKARKGSYDIENFRSNIPSDITKLSLGEEKKIMKAVAQPPSPLFENPIWLWAVMLVIIALLVLFSMRMLKSK
ncbi:DUF3999 family protein [Fulvivirga sp. M361]|uniref:DUF3999 family protein n=1 Tax=Fulvivirga sp. M361 TaxID=2594266 RepID=UPI00117A6FCB|nr:DUF3999 family protein [Fulvivirga sp. M361]TRX51296.1 DUF3999 family protein [Fulvivirga sp. M361]